MPQEALEAAERPSEAVGGESGTYPAPDPPEVATGPENGSERLVVPLESFRDAALHLRRPFTPEAIKWKVQSNFGEKGCLVVGYIDARLVIERLNLLLRERWSDDYRPLDSNYVRCDLTVDGITRPDVGQGSGKAGYSDALKRAAVKFGVGVSLYAIPRAELWLNQHDKYITMRKYKKNGKDVIEYRITPAGDAALRLRYAKWLEEVGVPKFGQPLDHGDVVGAVGDPDIASAIEGDPGGPDEIRELVEGPEADEIRRKATDTYEALVAVIKRANFPPGQFQAQLADAGHSLEALEGFRQELQGRLEEARGRRSDIERTSGVAQA